MTRHVHRRVRRSAKETAKLRADRDRYQRDKPTPAQLLADGGHAEFVSLGELMLIHQVTALLKKERERQKLTLADVSKRTGIDQAALSKLETGRNSNPTLDTLYRIATALGKVISCSLRNGPMRRRAKSAG